MLAHKFIPVSIEELLRPESGLVNRRNSNIVSTSPLHREHTMIVLLPILNQTQPRSRRMGRAFAVPVNTY